MCRAAKVRSPSARSVRDVELRPVIARVYNEKCVSFGTDKMWDHLNKVDGIAAAPSRLWLGDLTHVKTNDGRPQVAGQQFATRSPVTVSPPGSPPARKSPTPVTVDPSIDSSMLVPSMELASQSVS